MRHRCRTTVPFNADWLPGSPHALTTMTLPLLSIGAESSHIFAALESGHVEQQASSNPSQNPRWPWRLTGAVIRSCLRCAGGACEGMKATRSKIRRLLSLSFA